jgi:hypothetical protein
MGRVRLLLVLLVAAIGTLAAAGHAAPDPTTCTGYSEPRVFLGAQDWWMQTPGQTGSDQGHVHAEACVPYEQTVSGAVAFDVRVVMHDNPGHVSAVGVKLKQPGAFVPIGSTRVSLDCPPPGTCSWIVHVVADTARASYDGRAQLRIKAQGRTNDGFFRSAILRFPVFLANGKSRVDSAATTVGATGWYTRAGYTNVAVSRIPTEPVSGTWTVTAKFSLTPEPDGSGDAVTHRFASIDPDFHMGDPGTVIVDDTGPMRGSVAVDTTKLTNGPHRLFLRADAPDSRGSTNSGAFVVPFTVQN